VACLFITNPDLSLAGRKIPHILPVDIGSNLDLVVEIVVVVVVVVVFGGDIIIFDFTRNA